MGTLIVNEPYTDHLDEYNLPRIPSKIHEDIKQSKKTKEIKPAITCYSN